MVCENRHKTVCHCAKPEYTRKKCPHCLVIFNVCGLCKGKKEVEIKHKHPQQVPLHKPLRTNPVQGNIRIIKSPIKADTNQGLINKHPVQKSLTPTLGNKIVTSDGQGPIITRDGVFQVNKNNNKPIQINSADWSNLNKNLRIPTNYI